MNMATEHILSPFPYSKQFSPITEFPTFRSEDYPVLQSKDILENPSDKTLPFTAPKAPQKKRKTVSFNLTYNMVWEIPRITQLLSPCETRCALFEAYWEGRKQDVLGKDSTQSHDLNSNHGEIRKGGDDKIRTFKDQFSEVGELVECRTTLSHDVSR